MHDELDFSAPENKAGREALAEVKRIMENVVDISRQADGRRQDRRQLGRVQVRGDDKNEQRFSTRQWASADPNRRAVPNARQAGVQDGGTRGGDEPPGEARIRQEINRAVTLCHRRFFDGRTCPQGRLIQFSYHQGPPGNAAAADDGARYFRRLLFLVPIWQTPKQWSVRLATADNRR